MHKIQIIIPVCQYSKINITYILHQRTDDDADFIAAGPVPGTSPLNVRFTAAIESTDGFDAQSANAIKNVQVRSASCPATTLIAFTSKTIPYTTTTHNKITIFLILRYKTSCWYSI